MARTRSGRDAAAVALIPWWAWLALAVISWLIARLVVGSAPAPKGPMPQVLAASVFTAFWQVVSFVGPVVFALMALVSIAVRMTRGSVSENARGSETTTTSAQPVWGLDRRTWNMPLLKALEW